MCLLTLIMLIMEMHLLINLEVGCSSDEKEYVYKTGFFLWEKILFIVRQG
jgi:hypothetical protein